MDFSFDDAWHRKALAGDEAAVAALAQRTIAGLYQFCLYRVGGRRDLCEDVVQETLVRAIRDLEAYDPARAGGEIFPWLAGLARNEIRRALSQQAANAAASVQSLDDLWTRIDRDLVRVYSRLNDEPMQEALIEREETRQMVSATLSQLSPRYRSALEAKYIDGQSVRDIASAQGESEKAVESLLTRARQAFRETFLAIARHVSPDQEGVA